MNIGQKVSFVNLQNLQGTITNITRDDNKQKDIYWIDGKYMRYKEELQAI